MKTLRLFFLLVVAAAVTLTGTCLYAETKTYAEKRFEAMDTDGDGKISKEEFMASCEERFNTLDKNKDGYVTEEEFQEEVAKFKKSFRENRRNR